MDSQQVTKIVLEPNEVKEIIRKHFIEKWNLTPNTHQIELLGTVDDNGVIVSGVEITFVTSIRKVQYGINADKDAIRKIVNIGD